MKSPLLDQAPQPLGKDSVSTATQSCESGAAYYRLAPLSAELHLSAEFHQLMQVAVGGQPQQQSGSPVIAHNTAAVTATSAAVMPAETLVADARVPPPTPKVTAAPTADVAPSVRVDLNVEPPQQLSMPQDMPLDCLAALRANIGQRGAPLDIERESVVTEADPVMADLAVSAASFVTAGTPPSPAFASTAAPSNLAPVSVPELTELLQKHVRQLLIESESGPLAQPQHILLRMDAGLGHADILLQMTPAGWALKCQVMDPAQSRWLEKKLQSLVTRFDAKGLGPLHIEVEATEQDAGFC